MLTTNKPGLARYLGFGEQGGQPLLKRPTTMNYFNSDNMTYSSVYGIGPKDEREPLYHSEPYWLELGGIPGYQSQVSTFVDNYSQILVDFLSKNSGQIRTATRFGELQYFVFAGNGVGEIITSLTNIIGKSRLKPRYTLGHHQGCYGYDTREKVLKTGQGYVDSDIPLDGIHIDVDMQETYRTFTTNSKGKFPQPDVMFSELRKKGIVCATNITPVINNHDPDKTYPTLQEGLAKKYFLPDKRYDEFGKGPTPPREVEYSCYENGVELLIDPVHEMGAFPNAEYDFPANYNSGEPYRGGVGYGGTLGAPGFYLDLNVKAIREFWGKQYKFLLDKGLEFVWQDMTTPAIAKEYGDQKGLPFRLMITDDSWEAEASGNHVTKPAIEIWALYSYNLHKATYEGLNQLRGNKRNFIIGRGSFAGHHRYAGLWTGDNASTWDHFQISVCQVLAVGLSGNEIVGADVGGFMPPGGFEVQSKWADPELLIRWYCAYSLLPWFRNHYHGKRGMKLFQEPWAYTNYFTQNARSFKEQDRYSWLAVEPVCRYYVKLRYSLMQLLYDAMFEHQFTGLPISRALVITDPMDTTLLGENDWCLDNEYIVRKDLLVCPVMQRLSDAGGGREVYLPQGSSWYTFNLGIKPADRLPGRQLEKKHKGGDRFFVDAHISADTASLPKICPMFVREGELQFSDSVYLH